MAACLAIIGGAAANEPPLTAAQVAQLAYDMGFRGGSLVAAVAAASAESSFDPDAVCNNLHVLDGGGQPMYHGNGKPVLATISAYDGTMLPVGQVHPLPGGGQGRVISHCRGLWQINSGAHPTISNADAFTPSVAVRHAWGISRKGRFWVKWTSVMTGAAWESSRLATARAAARSVDTGVLPGSGLAGLRVEAWTSGGGVRTTAGGTFLRPITRGDTGTILEGPVIAAITQGIQTSRHLWYRVQWDHGTTGWSVEEYLSQRSAGPALPASPAYGPSPASGTVRVPVLLNAPLRWSIGANTKSIRLRFGTDPTLAGAETIRLSGGMQTEWITGPLEHYRNYYWRIDSESGNGSFVTGPTWTFRTEPYIHPVTVTGLALAPSPAGRGQLLTISGKIAAIGSQPLLIGASLGDYSDPARDLPFTAHASGSPTDFSRSFQLPADIPLGHHRLDIAVWYDANENGKIEYGDVRLFHTGIGLEVGDLTPPTLASLSAGPATVRPGQQVTLSATVRDSGGSGLTGVYFYRSVGEISPISWQIVAYRPASGDGPVTVTAQDIPFAEGRYWYEMEAVDAANNRTRLRVPTTVRATIPDLAPPTVQWTAPANGSTVAGGFITVAGQASDDRGVAFVRYRLNGGAWVQTSAFWSANIHLVPGSNVLEAVATDQAGKQSAVAKLHLYFPGSPSDPSVFDEQFGFDGDEVPPRWQLQVSGPPEQNGVIGGRLEAAGGGTAAIQANKMVPGWARAVELRFAPGEGAGMWWKDNQSRTWRVALRSNFLGQHTVEVGFDSTLQQIPVPAPPWGGAVNRIRTLWRDGSIDFWYLAQGSTTPVVRELAFPQLRLAGMSGPMEFRAGPFGGTAVLDDVQLRALRQEDLFAIHFLDARPGAPGQSSKVRWASFAGRNYAVEISPGLSAGSWSEVTRTTGDGLVAERNFPMPAGPRRFVRIRELP